MWLDSYLAYRPCRLEDLSCSRNTATIRMNGGVSDTSPVLECVLCEEQVLPVCGAVGELGAIGRPHPGARQQLFPRASVF